MEGSILDASEVVDEDRFAHLLKKDSIVSFKGQLDVMVVLELWARSDFRDRRPFGIGR